MAIAADGLKNTRLHKVEEAFLAGWKLVLAGAALGFVLAVLNLQGAVYSYPVQMQVTAAQGTNSDTGGGNRLSQLSGLASLASISLPTTQNAMQFQLYIDSLYTRDLSNDIAKNHEIMMILYGNQWDAASQTWRETPPSLFTRMMLSLRSFLGLAPSEPWQPPGGANVLSFLANSLTVTQDPRKPYMATLTLNSPNKAFAIRFLNLLSKTADDRLRQQALGRAQDYINYLSKKLETVSAVEHRAAITEALSEQERYAMVASSDRPFAAEVFESPWASNLPSSPSPRQVFLIFVMLGAFAGLGISYLRLKYAGEKPAWLAAMILTVRRRRS